MANKFVSNQIVKVDGKGRYRVIGCLPNQFTKYALKDIDRGKGWDENKQTYKGYYVAGGNCVTDTWSRGQNHTYGETFYIHRKRISLFS